MATVAALLTTLSSVGGFQAKWKADRNAFYALDELVLDAQASLDDADRLRRRLHRIIRSQHQAWIEGADTAATEGTDEA